ncbi:MAG: hypothetical protein J6P61_09315 [Erysipelotrichaceae bacterium]|nr:hypothetical protein [Erysipelotrichaceae bacterium]
MYLRNKILSIGLCMALLSACGQSPQQETSVVPHKAEAETVILKEKGHSVSIPEEKEETVNVTADAYGHPVKKEVEVLLKAFDESDIVKDYTDLTDIKNIKGDEEFTLKDNGLLLWQNHDEDITYQGISEDPLPVDVKISYKLDGHAIKAKDLAGKSGRLTMRFDYINHETYVDNGVGVYVPFTAISAVMLDEDVFKNVKVKNGSITSMGDTSVAMGMCFPGLSQSLDLKSLELTEEIDIPDRFEIKADVTNFELDYTATIITSGLLKDVDLSNLDDVSDLNDALNDLDKASNKLVNGSAELYKGANQFSRYFDQYIDGINQVSKGAQSLSEAMNELDQTTSEIASILKTYLSSLSKMKEALNQDEIKKLIEESEINFESLEEALNALSQEAETLSELIVQLQSVLTAYQTYQETISEAAKRLNGMSLNNLEASIEEDAIKSAQESASKVLNETELSDEEKDAVLKAIESGIKEGIDLSDLISDITKEVQTITDASDQLADIDTTSIDAVLKDMSKQLSTINQAIKTFGELFADSDFSEMFKSLDTDIDSLTDQVNAYTSAISQLNKGSHSLSEGTNQLADSGSLLAKNYKKLVKGMKALSKGMKLFDRKGINKLKNLGGDDLEDFVNRLQLLQSADEEYDNYSGKLKEESSSVKFIIETESIKNEE